MAVRTLPALVLATLLALGGLAAARDGGRQDDAGGRQDDGGRPADADDCSRAKDRAACRAGCPDRADDSRCRAGNGTGPSARPDDRGPGARDRLEHIAFTEVTATEFAALRVEGQPTLDGLTFLSGGGASATERRGDTLVLGDGDSRLRLHDNPAGHIEFKGDDGSVRLSFPAGVQVVAGERGHAARIHYPDGRDGLLVANDAAWDGRNVTLTGFFTFHLARGAGPFADASPGGGELRSHLRTAVERRHLGAEVALARQPTNASEAVQVMAYDDLDVQVQLPNGTAPIAVRLAAELGEGRTVAIRVDPALLGNSTADRLELRYFDHHADGTRTEVLFLRASSLADALDPTDDGGQPEHWVMKEDADGIQVLVSVPHWSVHTVTIAGLGALLQPSVMAGILAGAAGTAVAAVAMFWPRRRDE